MWKGGGGGVTIYFSYTDLEGYSRNAPCALHKIYTVLLYDAQHHIQQYFDYTMVVSFIGGRNWIKPLTSRSSLTNFITEECIPHTNIILYMYGRFETPLIDSMSKRPDHQTCLKNDIVL